MKDFNLENALRGETVVTKEGEFVSGLRLREHPIYPIRGIIKRLYEPDEAFWTIDGKSWINKGEYHLDLRML